MRSGGVPVPGCSTVTTGCPATSPEKATTPAAAAWTGSPAAAVRSTPRCPAAHAAGGGANRRSTPAAPPRGQARPGPGLGPVPGGAPSTSGDARALAGNGPAQAVSTRAEHAATRSTVRPAQREPPVTREPKRMSEPRTEGTERGRSADFKSADFRSADRRGADLSGVVMPRGSARQLAVTTPVPKSVDNPGPVHSASHLYSRICEPTTRSPARVIRPAGPGQPLLGKSPACPRTAPQRPLSQPLDRRVAGHAALPVHFTTRPGLSGRLRTPRHRRSSARPTAPRPGPPPRPVRVPLGPPSL